VYNKYVRGYGLPDYAKKASTMVSPKPVTPQPVTPSNKMVTVTASSLNIRNKPTTVLSSVIGVLKKDSKVTPIKIEGSFVYIEGWCSTSYLK
jgi:uncharacterized protein YgiM (DUF1202 family)